MNETQERRYVAETYRLQWDRQYEGDGKISQRIRYRRRGGAWCEAHSLDELPDDVRQVYEQIRSDRETPADAATDYSDRRQSATRRHLSLRLPTRSREIDRALVLDHPWFSGWTFICLLIAAIAIGYNAWPDLADGGWATLGSGLLLLLAALMAYYALCVLINATEFRVDDRWLTVRHGPLPWFGNRRIPVTQILQITTRMHRTRHTRTYSLRATLAGHPSVQLAEGIETAAEARSIERAIERHLGIEDWD